MCKQKLVQISFIIVITLFITLFVTQEEYGESSRVIDNIEALSLDETEVFSPCIELGGICLSNKSVQLGISMP